MHSRGFASSSRAPQIYADTQIHVSTLWFYFLLAFACMLLASLHVDISVNMRSYYDSRLVRTCSTPSPTCLLSKISELFSPSAFGLHNEFTDQMKVRLIPQLILIRDFSQHAMLRLLASLRQASAIWTRWDTCTTFVLGDARERVRSDMDKQ